MSGATLFEIKYPLSFFIFVVRRAKFSLDLAKMNSMGLRGKATISLFQDVSVSFPLMENDGYIFHFSVEALGRVPR